MRGLLFACDIDNTLISSHRHPHGGWPCVEWLGGREQAYMSPGTARLLEGLPPGLTLVPATTRSREQYLRLRLPGKMPLALTANGADLLVDGTPDPAWRAGSDARIAPWRGELDRLLAILEGQGPLTSLRIVDGAFLFAGCPDGDGARRVAASLAGRTSLGIAVTGRKLYLLPPPLDKGAALIRLTRRLGAKRTAAAGDSAMDLPMLRAADVAIAPRSLAGDLPEGAFLCPEDRVFSEFALETAMGLLNGHTKHRTNNGGQT